MFDIRNNPKCLFNDTGFCKFCEQCRRQHYKTVCLIQNCDKKCKSRHPKPCRFKQKCKFFAQNICAFKHATSAWDDAEGIATLKKEIESLKLENETKLSKLVSLEEEVKSLKFIKSTSEESYILKVSELEKQLDALNSISSQKDETIKQKNAQINNLEMKLNKRENDIKVMKNPVQEISSKTDEKTAEPPKADTEKFLEPHPCDTCDFTSKSKTGLKNHVRAKHPKSSTNTQEKSNDHINEGLPKPFNCANCEFHFRSHDSLELLDHCRDVHGWFMCRNWMAGDGCEYETTNAEDLNNHMMNHCEYNQH